MTGIVNPKKYDTKVPTNVRIDDALKKLALAECKEKGITLAQIVNEALQQRYCKGGVNNDTSSHT